MAGGIPDVAALYGGDFFREWGRGNARFVSSARKIAEVIHREFSPRRIVDVGCGCGVYADAFRSLGAGVVAIDGVVPPAEHAFPGPVEIRDLRVPFANEWGAFDVVLCLEVAEHIAEEHADAFLANLAGLGDLVLFSHAPERQGGLGHVNEQPKRYWIAKFDAIGFAYDRKRTGVLMETWKRDKPGYMWMAEHICVFRRRVTPSSTSTSP